MTALTSMSEQSGDHHHGSVTPEDFASRPAYSSLSPRPRGWSKTPGGSGGGEGEASWVPGWTLSPGEVATSPRTGTRASAPRAALEELEEEEEDPVEEELVRGILSSRPGLVSSYSPPGGGLRDEAGTSPRGMKPHTSGFTELAEHAATVASAEVAGGSMPATSFLGSLSFVQVQMMSFIVVFSASGLVSWDDMIFAAFSTVYCAILSLWAFPMPHSPDPHHHMRRPPPRVFSDSTLFKIHVSLGAALGMFLPLSYVLGGFARGDHEAVQCATPHLFLLCCQVLTENILVTFPAVSLPVRAILPMMYNTRRIFSLAAWVRSLYLHVDPPRPSASGPELTAAAATLGRADLLSPMSEPTSHPYWKTFGKVLAVANLIYWSINLLAFLIPVFLPLAFRRYLQLEKELEEDRGRRAKKAE